MNRSVPPGCLSVAVVLLFLSLLPLLFAHAVFGALARLGLGPVTSILVLVGMFVGSTINIPVKKIPRDRVVHRTMTRMYGLERFLRPRMREFQHTILAVNVGGCVIPCLLSIYEFIRLGRAGPSAILAALVAIGITAGICYATARPMQGVGITMPIFIPPLVAATAALLFTEAIGVREMAPPMAFVAGVLGTLIGADLLHMKSIRRIGTGFASIGGAGTFDGIVLSGLIATLLA